MRINSPQMMMTHPNIVVDMIWKRAKVDLDAERKNI